MTSGLPSLPPNGVMGGAPREGRQCGASLARRPVGVIGRWGSVADRLGLLSRCLDAPSKRMTDLGQRPGAAPDDHEDEDHDEDEPEIAHPRMVALPATAPPATAPPAAAPPATAP